MGSTPVFNAAPNVNWATLTTVDATPAKTHNGTGTLDTDIFEIFEAGASGGYVESIVGCSLGDNVASVLRVFINNGQVNTTAANNSLIKEIMLPPTSISEGAPLIHIEEDIARNLPAGYRILVCLSATVATGWNVTAFGVDY